MYGGTPAQRLDATEALAGTKAPPDLRRTVDAPAIVEDRIRRLAAASAPGPVELARRLAAGDADATAVLDEIAEEPVRQQARASALGLLRAVLRQAEELARAQVRARGPSELVMLLQPVHQKLIDELDELDRSHPGFDDLGAEAMLDAPRAAQQAWTRRRELAARIVEVEDLGTELRGPNDTATVTTERGNRITVTFNVYGELWWEGLPDELAMAHYRGRSAWAPGASPPTWAACAAAGARRVLRTRDEAIAAAAEAHNRVAARSPERGPFGQPAMTPIVAQPA